MITLAAGVLAVAVVLVVQLEVGVGGVDAGDAVGEEVGALAVGQHVVVNVNIVNDPTKIPLRT